MKGQLLSLPPLDPTVQAAINSGNRRQAQATLPREERARVAKQRAKDSKRNRFNMDLDPQLDQALRAVAEDLRCPASGLAELAIALLLDSVDRGLDLSQYLERSRSPRYEYTVNLDSAIPDFILSRGSP